ncbi:MAG: hypothetical protein R6W81_10025 [Bacteroidales bacterium]
MPEQNSKDSILDYLKIKPSPQSIDYVENKKQFHLYTLLTEQRHPKTWTLSSVIKENTREGLKMLLSVDEDISDMIDRFSEDLTLAGKAVNAIHRAIKEKRKIYFYGCGSTGRLAKMMESTLWRPFWRKMKRSAFWEKLSENFPDDIEDRLIGEMTGADRALISSLEGFEDLQLIGRLQLIDRGIEKGDVVFCVTEGGETSSVIGTIMTALDQYGNPDEKSLAEAAGNLFFVYNNPDNLLLPFERSKMVLRNPGITKLNLTTGPQAITGSTRMQATTSEIFVLGSILEEALYRVMREYLSSEELSLTGFEPETNLYSRLKSFRDVKISVDNTIDSLREFTESETETYAKRGFSTYFAGDALITVFTDSTERSPTFRLYPLDTVNADARRSWIQVWTESRDIKDAWQVLLGRGFRGLEEPFYKPFFEEEIDDPYLKNVALKSLANAGNDQERFYDLSFSESNITRYTIHPDDIGVIVCVNDEHAQSEGPGSGFRKFAEYFQKKGAKVTVITVNGSKGSLSEKPVAADGTINISLPAYPDPIGLRKQIALKMLLNTHSTGVMAKLGRVIGNTMTTVNPSNLKLIGRATYLIMSHVNDTISGRHWTDRHGVFRNLTFGEVNAVLYDAIDYVSGNNPGQTAEVPLSIIRILEALKNRDYFSWEGAQSILDCQGLDAFLTERNPTLSSAPPLEQSPHQ